MIEESLKFSDWLSKHWFKVVRYFHPVSKIASLELKRMSDEAKILNQEDQIKALRELLANHEKRVQRESGQQITNARSHNQLQLIRLLFAQQLVVTQVVIGTWPQKNFEKFLRYSDYMLQWRTVVEKLEESDEIVSDGRILVNDLMSKFESLFLDFYDARWVHETSPDLLKSILIKKFTVCKTK